MTQIFDVSTKIEKSTSGTVSMTLDHGKYIVSVQWGLVEPNVNCAMYVAYVVDYSHECKLIAGMEREVAISHPDPQHMTLTTVVFMGYAEIAATKLAP